MIKSDCYVDLAFNGNWIFIELEIILNEPLLGFAFHRKGSPGIEFQLILINYDVKLNTADMITMKKSAEEGDDVSNKAVKMLLARSKGFAWEINGCDTMGTIAVLSRKI